MSSEVKITIAIIQMTVPIIFLIIYFINKRRMKRTRKALDDLFEVQREIMLTTFLRDNPEIDPEIFEEEKEPIVPSREKPRHHFNHKGGDYFM
jgi:hypothetical protein